MNLPYLDILLQSTLFALQFFKHEESKKYKKNLKNMRVNLKRVIAWLVIHDSAFF